MGTSVLPIFISRRFDFSFEGKKNLPVGIFHYNLAFNGRRTETHLFCLTIIRNKYPSLIFGARLFFFLLAKKSVTDIYAITRSINRKYCSAISNARFRKNPNYLIHSKGCFDSATFGTLHHQHFLVLHHFVTSGIWNILYILISEQAIWQTVLKSNFDVKLPAGSTQVRQVGQANKRGL